MRKDVRYKDLQLGTLRTFCTVATHGTFTEASRKLHLSTTTVWQQVQSLERVFGIKLFRKQGRSVVLTQDGTLLFTLVQTHVAGLDSLVRLFEAQRAGMAQQITIASTPYLVSYHLPQPIQQFIAQHPGVQLNFLIMRSLDDILRCVEHGEADLGLTIREAHDLPLPSLQYDELFPLSLTLLTALRHPLGRKKKLVPSDLADYPLVMPAPGGVDAPAIQRLLALHNLNGRIRSIMETPHFDIIVRYVALNVGIALCHANPTAKVWMEGVDLREFDASLPRLPVVMVTHKGTHATPAVQACRLVLKRSLIDQPNAIEDTKASLA